MLQDGWWYAVAVRSGTVVLKNKRLITDDKGAPALRLSGLVMDYASSR